MLQSGLEEEYKLYFLGEGYRDVCRTNVPLIRLRCVDGWGMGVIGIGVNILFLLYTHD